MQTASFRRHFAAQHIARSVVPDFTTPRYLVGSFMMLATVAALFCLAPLAEAQSPASCSFTMINPPSAYTGDFFLFGITHYGTVVGGAYTANQNSEKGYIRNSSGGTRMFAFPSSTYTEFYKRNGSGASVGQYSNLPPSTPPTSGSHGLLLASSTYATLDYPGAGATELGGINKSNVIVGSALSTTTGGSFGFKRANGTFTRITYPGAVQTTATAINDNGVIVGGYEPGSFENPWLGYVLHNGTFKSLSFIPSDINNSGTMVAGNSIYYPNGTVKTVTVPSSDQTHVNGINDLGTITGAAHSGGTPGTWKGFIATCQ
jgi:hypothetical protein